MSNKQFPIGFWNCQPAVRFGVEGVQDWVDFGATLTMTGFYESDPNKEAMLAILDECYAKGLQMIFTDRRIGYDHFHDEGFEELMRQDVADFGSHPAVYGFYLGDEPTEELMEDAVKTVQLFRSLCPDKEPFLNLLPWVPELNDMGLIASAQNDYKEHVLDFVRRTGVRILSYDCYMQMCECRREVLDPTALDSYYYNLNLFSQVAKETDTELWYTTLAVGHGMYRCPTQDDARWEISTAVACGAKAIFYWHLYSDGYNINYRNHPFNFHMEKTETFDWFSNENRIFQKVYGNVFTQLELDKVYHIGQAYGGYELLQPDSDEFIRNVRTNNDSPLILSRFTHPNEPDTVYYALVNNSQRECTRAHVEFARSAEMFAVWNGDDEHPHLTGAQKMNAGDESRRFWFSPGQMWVFAVKKQ